MGEINYYHKNLKDRWKKFPLNFQMANIGSEVSRALRQQKAGDKKLMDDAVARALELIDFSIDSAKEDKRTAEMHELCVARYVLCDYFYGENEFNQTPESVIKYYDEFAGIIL